MNIVFSLTLNTKSYDYIVWLLLLFCVVQAIMILFKVTSYKPIFLIFNMLSRNFRIYFCPALTQFALDLQVESFFFCFFFSVCFSFCFSFILYPIFVQRTWRSHRRTGKAIGEVDEVGGSSYKYYCTDRRVTVSCYPGIKQKFWHERQHCSSGNDVFQTQ